MLLYLGLNPTRWKTDLPVLHYPVIRLKPRTPKKPSDWKNVTHLLFTSQSAVKLWPFFDDKKVLAIGEATAAACKEKGAFPLIAPEATQEGMIALLQTLNLEGSYILWPRSSQARNVLHEFFGTSPIKCRFEAIDLYDVCTQKLEPVPNLDKIEEIVFTSPSTVEGFLRIYGFLPKTKKLTAIGPITERALTLRLHTQ